MQSTTAIRALLRSLDEYIQFQVDPISSSSERDPEQPAQGATPSPKQYHDITQQYDSLKQKIKTVFTSIVDEVNSETLQRNLSADFPKKPKISKYISFNYTSSMHTVRKALIRK
jgi:hypothetical protein